MKIEIKKLSEKAIIPVYQNPGDAGLDLCSIEEYSLHPNETKLIKTGLAISLPDGIEAQIRPRSGLALKHSITVLNTPGTIDSGYRGEVSIILINHGKETFYITPGMRIAQMVIAPVLRAEIEEVESLDETQRGTGGFGSTGEYVTIKNAH